jgi:MFS family permease
VIANRAEIDRNGRCNVSWGHPDGVDRLTTGSAHRREPLSPPKVARPSCAGSCPPSPYNEGLSEGRIAFRYPSFRRYLTARFLATVSSEMQAVAVGWQIYALTGRPLDLGLVGLAQFLPGMLLFLAAGHTADHRSRRRILEVCYTAFACCSAALLGLSLYGLSFVWPIYAVLLANGVVRAFNGPATQAFMPQILPEEHFPNGVAWASSIGQGAQVAGPMLGGIIYGATGSPIPVYAGAVAAYLTALFLISRVQVAAPPRPRASASLRVVLEGLRYIWVNKIILGTISLDLFAVLLGGAVALLPVYAREVLRVGAFGLGLLRAGPGIGAVMMATVVAHHPLRRRAGKMMLWCVAGFGVFTIVFGLSSNIVLSMAALIAVGACDMVSVIIRHTLVQLGTPDEMRGRVSAVNMVFIGASNEVGQFESGLTAQWWGAETAVLVGGIGTLVIVGLWAWFFPALRRTDRIGQKIA